MLTFFGLGPNYRPVLHEMIFDLLEFSEGKLSWTEIYNMPIWLRKFYYNKFKTKYNLKYSNSNNATNLVDRPEFLLQNIK